jgi:hypothetical protein
MKKILKYSTILGAVAMLGIPIPLASADTGGYVRVKGVESHFTKLGFNQLGCLSSNGNNGTDCLFASESKDSDSASTATIDLAPGTTAEDIRNNELRWVADDSYGLVVGADYGFFRLEVSGQYSDGKALQWREHKATGGTVYQARLFANIVVEPLDLLQVLGEFGGVDSLVKYNPATYGISPYASYGYGVMGGLLSNLAYTREGSATYSGRTADATENGAWAGGATAAVSVGAGVNIGLDQLARGVSNATGGTLPEYFKLPIEFSIGYEWQVGLDDLLFESVNENLGIQDGGITYSVGLKW